MTDKTIAEISGAIEQGDYRRVPELFAAIDKLRTELLIVSGTKGNSVLEVYPQILYRVTCGKCRAPADCEMEWCTKDQIRHAVAEWEVVWNFETGLPEQATCRECIDKEYNKRR